MTLTLRPEYEQGSTNLHTEYDEDLVLRMVPYLKGDPGDSAAQFVHEQSVASTFWIVNHNKGYRPDVHVYTPGYVEVEAHVTHVNVNQLTVQFTTAQTGYVHC